MRARGEPAGASAIDPKILLGLWIYATSDGVGSGREIARLVELHAAYRWLCGGVEVAYRCLNDFRSEHGEIFDDLVTQILARLIKHDLIDLHRVAQDGTRIRASAGAASFINRGSDHGQASPMLEQIEARTGVRPSEFLVDGGDVNHDAIDQATAVGVTIYAPVPKPRLKSAELPVDPVDPHLAKPGDSDAVAAWRVRMGTDDAKEIYKERAATAETVNADAKAHRGMAATALRGIDRSPAAPASSPSPTTSCGSSPSAASRE